MALYTTYACQSVRMKCYFSGDGKGAEGRIIGGQEAAPHSIPYHVGLSSNHLINEAFCGGALITPTHVLTGR